MVVALIHRKGRRQCRDAPVERLEAELKDGLSGIMPGCIVSVVSASLVIRFKRIWSRREIKMRVWV